jgi:hypothetical protein
MIYEPMVQKIENGYELDWMAQLIKGCGERNVITWGLQEPVSAGRDFAATVMNARCALSRWHGQWQDTVNSISEAIEASMDFLYSNSNVTINKDHLSTQHLEWKLRVEVEVDPDGSHFEEIALSLKRSKRLDGPLGP